LLSTKSYGIFAEQSIKNCIYTDIQSENKSRKHFAEGEDIFIKGLHLLFLQNCHFEGAKQLRNLKKLQKRRKQRFLTAFRDDKTQNCHFEGAKRLRNLRKEIYGKYSSVLGLFYVKQNTHSIIHWRNKRPIP
jgi:hypothetical protein